jgi:hypothetical protein
VVVGVTVAGVAVPTVSVVVGVIVAGVAVPAVSVVVGVMVLGVPVVVGVVDPPGSVTVGVMVLGVPVLDGLTEADGLTETEAVGVIVVGVPVVPVVGVTEPSGVLLGGTTVTVISRAGMGETWAYAVGSPSAFISGLTYVLAATTPTAAVAEPANRRRLNFWVDLVPVTASRSSPVAANRDTLG